MLIQLIKSISFGLAVATVYASGNVCAQPAHAIANAHELHWDAIYPSTSTKLPLATVDYDKLRAGIAAYVGDRFQVVDPQCLGGTVALATEVNKFFEVTSLPTAGSIEPGIYFVSGTMLHGGMCQTGVVFSSNRNVLLVATYRGGTAPGFSGAEPSVLSIYINDPASRKYTKFLQHWASSVTRIFSSTSPLFPKTYDTRIYNLKCRMVGKKVDVSKCRIQ